MALLTVLEAGIFWRCLVFFVCPIYVHRLVVVVLLGGVILIDLSVRFSDLLSSSAQEVDKAGHHGQGTRNVL
jgi:hypothetical protein